MIEYINASLKVLEAISDIDNDRETEQAIKKAIAEQYRLVALCLEKELIDGRQ